MKLDPDTLTDEHKVTMPYAHIFVDASMAIMWDWCTKSCIGDFDCTVPDMSGKMTWLFENPIDRTMFALRWV